MELPFFYMISVLLNLVNCLILGSNISKQNTLVNAAKIIYVHLIVCPGFNSLKADYRSDVWQDIEKN